MNYTSKYDVGQIVEFSLDYNGSTRYGKVNSVVFSGLPNETQVEYLMENDGSFIPESDITAVLERYVTKQIELPLECAAV